MNEKTTVSAWTHRSGPEVCICGVGARTAVGLSAEATAAAVRGKISGLALHPSFADQEGQPVSFAADAALKADVLISERMAQMLQTVTEEVLSHAQTIAPVDIDGCWLALPERRSGLPADIEAYLSNAASEYSSFASDSIRVLSQGHAAGLIALQTAAEAISRGEIATALVLGVDSYHDLHTIQSLDVRRRLMATRNPGGFPPGEAAAGCLLIRGDLAERRGYSVLAKAIAAATVVEPCNLRSNEPCLGEGLTSVLASVATALQIPQEVITASFCDLNGERYRSEEFAFALMRTQEVFADAHNYISPADCWGDVGAASGLLFTALAVIAGLRGYSQGNYPVLWAGSDSGLRSAVLLSLGNSEARH